jgi:EAL domain-containing protein (putative c-di-GMP-specific phosphodiesterase class I)
LQDISGADLSCEAARSSGGNQVMVNSAVADEMTIAGSNANHEEIISTTLAENRIMIYYQPISSLKYSPGNNLEILVRIVDGSGNIIMPGEFFSMAETTGQAADIDLHVIEKVMQVMAKNRDKEMTLFIKLTRQSVADHDFPLWVTGKIKEYNINPEKLVFEIAEGVENPTSLAILWELGVSLAQAYFIQAPAGSLDFDSQVIAAENKAEESNKSTFTIG